MFGQYFGNLENMPPALFTVGADDHFIDDNILMASRWARAGNRTELMVYPEAPHACIAMPRVIADWLPRVQGFLRSCVES